MFLQIADTNGTGGPKRDGGRERVSEIPDATVLNEAFVSLTADGQPAIISCAGAEHAYSVQ
ncbi:MAG: hypothetical protein WA374_03745 [Acidobacteriaceae bacterium]